MGKFTDEDLARLRNEIDHTDHFPKLGALLARLEAAEAVINYEKRWDCCVHTAGNKCQMAVAWEAWRKSAGKE